MIQRSRPGFSENVFRQLMRAHSSDATPAELGEMARKSTDLDVIAAVVGRRKTPPDALAEAFTRANNLAVLIESDGGRIYPPYEKPGLIKEVNSIVKSIALNDSTPPDTKAAIMRSGRYPSVIALMRAKEQLK